MKRSYSRAIVPYVARQNKYARVGMALGNFAWRNRKAIARRGISISRGIYKKIKASKYGKRIQAAPSRRSNESDTVNQVLASFGHRQLQYQALANFPPADSINNDGRRNKNVMFFTGAKVCYIFRHRIKWADGGRPMQLHFAIVQLKTKGAGVANLRGGFFVDKSQLVGKETDFVDALPSQVYDARYNCCGLNKANMNIITHIKRIIHPPPDPTTGGLAMLNTKYICKIDKYYSFRKRLEFNSMNALQPEHAIACVYWVHGLTPADCPTSVTPSFSNVDAMIDCNCHNTVYYRT